MIRHLLHHFWLLASFKHDSNGLPSTYAGVAFMAIFFVCGFIMARIFTEQPDVSLAAIVTSLFIMLAFPIYVFTKRQCSGIYLMLGCFDFISALSPAFFGQILSFWSLSAMVLFIVNSWQYEIGK